MTEPTIALVFSPEPWVEALHRHCVDHGGARVHHVVVDPRVALEEDYDTLVVSHRWTGLTPGLVAALHERGRRVLGVFELSEAAGHGHLDRLDVDAIVAADASMEVFVDAIVDLGTATVVPGATATASTGRELGRLVAVGSPSGAGATEVAIALSRALAGSGGTVALVDADEVVPAVTPRLGLPLEPNLRSAIDGLVYEDRPEALVPVGSGSQGFGVLGGLPYAATWAQVRPEDVLLVLEGLAARHDTVVVNVGSRLELIGEEGRDRFGITRALVGVADSVVLVTAGTPVGVIRAVGWCSERAALGCGCPVHLVVNRAPKDSFRRSELAAELHRSKDAASVGFLPEDPRVVEAAWNGDLVRRGPFTRGVEELAERVRVAPARSGAAL